MLAGEAECLDDLLVGKHDRDVVGLAAQAGDQLGDGGPAPRAEEVVLRVETRQPSGARLGHVA